MTTVETVLGPVDADALGTVLVHEHVRFRDEAVVAQWPSAYDAEHELAAALESVQAAQQRGVATICDPTAMFGGRDTDFMRLVAERSGVQIVACTGIYTYDYLPHFFENRSEDQIAAMFVDDIQTGMQGTDSKAGFLKCAADAAGVTPNVEKVHRAVARASVQTGAPIMAHSRPASDTGPRQIEIFEEEGVDLARVQIAHTGDTDDLDYIERVLSKGVFIGLDRYGLDMFLPFDRRQATFAELLRRGHVDRLLLGQDFCATIDWFPEEAVAGMVEAGLVRDWSMTLLWERVFPELKERGELTDEQIDTMLVDNARRWLAGSA
jgi:phosphotriesterase-related protein